MHRYFHLSAARALAMASAAGINWAVPASISAMRRSVSAAHAPSISLSSSRLAIRCSASLARSATV